MQTLKKLLNDWAEPDDAMGFLGCLIGIIDYEGDIFEFVTKNKINILHSNNQISTLLFNMLEQMVAVGFLEKNDDWEYRWNQSFKGFWEGGKGGY